jgi:hypothetical protein
MPLAIHGPASSWPDLAQRAEAVFGHRIITPGGAALVIEGRDGC